MYKKLICAALFCIGFALPSCNTEKIEKDGVDSREEERSGVMNLCLSEEKAAAIEAGGTLEANGIKIKSINRMFPDAGEFEARHREMGLHKWYIVHYDESVPVTKAYSGLGSIEGVEIVEKVAKSRPAEVKIPFNDVIAKRSQWHLYNDGSLLKDFKAGADINVLPLWNAGIVGDKKVIVAVMDTGADVQNPDLADVLIPCGDNGSKNFLNGAADATKYTIYPGDHGTHVAGIIAAVNNNNTGVCGIAGGNDGKGGVRILNLQIMGKIPGAAKTENGNEASALVWAADHGAVIVNNSWDYAYKKESDVPGNNSFSLISIHLAIDYFIKNAGCNSSGEQAEDSPMKGGLVLFAAGNSRWSKGQPGMYEKVLAVGSCGPAFEDALYTNYGDWVDICAPGGNYRNYSNNHIARICSSTKGASFGYMQGTSMACPMVAGVAALLVSHYGGKGFTAEKLKKMLLDGANRDAQKHHSEHIGPMLDAHGALISQTPVPEVTDLKAHIKRKSVKMEWTVGKEQYEAVYSYLAIISRSIEKIRKYNPVSPSGSDTTSIVRPQEIGEISSSFEEMGFGQYYGAVFAVRKSHQHSPVSNIVSIKVENNQTNSIPVIKTWNEGPVTLKYRDTFLNNFILSDDDDDKLTVSTEEGSAAAVWKKVNENNYQLAIRGSDAPPGTYKAKITAEDAFGGKAEKSFIYTIAVNAPVKISKAFENTTLSVGESMEINLAEHFKDEDEDEIVYKVKSSYGGVQCRIKGEKLNIYAAKYGIANIEISAKDAGGPKVNGQFILLASDAGAGYRIYPNPMKDRLNLASDKRTRASVRIMNTNGKVIYKESWESNPYSPKVLDVTNYKAGLYKVEFSVGGKVYEENVVKL